MNVSLVRRHKDLEDEYKAVAHHDAPVLQRHNRV